MRPSGNGQNWSYTMNCDVFPVNWVAIGGAPNMTPPPYTQWYRKIRVTDISAPTRVLFVGEMPWTPNSNDPYLSELGGDWNHGPLNHNSFVAAPAGRGIAYYPPLPYTECAAWFHFSAMNCLFVDGHVEQVSHSTLTNYATAVDNGGPCPGGICQHYYVGDGSPGCYFWNDNRGTCGPSGNQAPGGPYGRQWASE